MEPFGPHPDIYKLCRSTRLPIAETIGIPRLHEKNFKLLKFLKLLTKDGFVPDKSHSNSSKTAKLFMSPIHENNDPFSLVKSPPLSRSWLKETSILNEVRNSMEINFTSRVNSCNDKNLLEELRLEKDKLVPSILRVRKEVALGKLGKNPERYVFPEKSRTLSFFDWKILGGNHP
jgi:hypothetical protein